MRFCTFYMLSYPHYPQVFPQQFLQKTSKNQGFSRVYKKFSTALHKAVEKIQLTENSSILDLCAEDPLEAACLRRVPMSIYQKGGIFVHLPVEP